MHVQCLEEGSERGYIIGNNLHVFGKLESWKGKDHLEKEVPGVSLEVSIFLFFCK